MTHNGDKLKTPSISLWNKGFEPHIWHLNFLRPAPERQAAKTSSFESQENLHSWDTQQQEWTEK